MSKSLSTTENKSLAKFEEDNESLLSFLPRAESSDFDIPRLTLIQPTSKIEGHPGDVIDSSTGQKVASLNQKLIFAPVWFLKDFSITEVDSKKFRRNEPKTAQNAHLSAFDNRIGTDSDGVAVERKERLSIFVIQSASLDDDLPRVYRMLLRPSSFKEAKKFLSEWDIQVRSRLAPFQFLWSVTPKQITNDKGKFCIYEFQKVLKDNKQLKVSPEQLQKIKFWVKTLQANQEKMSEVVEAEVNQTEDIPF